MSDAMVINVTLSKRQANLSPIGTKKLMCKECAEKRGIPLTNYAVIDACQTCQSERRMCMACLEREGLVTWETRHPIDEPSKSVELKTNVVAGVDVCKCGKRAALYYPSVTTKKAVYLVDEETWLKKRMVEIGLKPDLSTEYLRLVLKAADIQGISNKTPDLTSLFGDVSKALRMRDLKR